MPGPDVPSPQGISLATLGGVFIPTPANGDALTYQVSTGLWIAAPGGAVSSVSNSDGTLTISPTTGAVVASLALGNANTWTAVQTFTNSDLRLLGSSTGYTTFASANSSATDYTITFPAATGTVALTSELPTSLAWSSITAPIGAAGFTAPAGDETTFTVQSTTQTGFTWTSSTLTTGFLAAMSVTGTSAMNGTNILRITSSATGMTGLTGIGVAISGALSNSGVTNYAGLFEVLTTNATSGTNIALWIAAEGATTANWALYANKGNIYLGGLLTNYNAITTVGNGIPSEYASTLTTAISLGTTSTASQSYTPTIAGQFLVVVCVVSAASSITGTLTVTYTDPNVGGTATQSIAVAAISAGAAETYTFLCNATTATAIAVAGTASTGSDLHATCTILAL